MENILIEKLQKILFFVLIWLKLKSKEQEELSDAIINFQVKHHVNDTDLAFASHLSVEKVHAMKTGDGQFTAEEVNQLYDYMSANA